MSELGCEDVASPALRFVLRLEVELGPVQDLGVLDGLRRRVVPIIGGRLSGHGVAGQVLAGGADWQTVRPGDGLTRVYARYGLRLDDGALVSVENSGLRRAPPEVSARLLAGEAVSPGSYYFRTQPRFETAAPRHAWLNETVFVASGRREPDRVVLDVFALD